MTLGGNEDDVGDDGCDDDDLSTTSFPLRGPFDDPGEVQELNAHVLEGGGGGVGRMRKEGR
jgi:hypothetical protein